jgi:c-di-GMP-binding flagellar brake protein YcgR
MPEGVDRRQARRFSMSLPMRVLPREARGNELRANTRDVSYRGLYFLSETKFDVGSQIDFIIKLPEPVSATGVVDIRCTGRVVRVEAGRNGTSGIAAKIERYEFLPINASATAASAFLF